MAKLQLNIARRPFVNQRPLVVGTALATAVLAVVTFLNVHEAVSKWARLEQSRQHVAANRAEALLARQEADKADAELGAGEAKRIRRIAGRVSGIIQKRRLSWSRLLDHLAEVMPGDARVLSVVPATDGTRVDLLLSAVAKSNEAKLRFFSRLNEPPFSNAHIMGETIEGKVHRFTIRCRYDREAAERIAHGGPDASGRDAAAGEEGKVIASRTLPGEAR